MCIHDHAINRRRLGSLFLGVAGAALLPRAAFASAKIKAMCVTCIDYRFLNKDAAFIANELDLFKNGDIVALAGGSLAAIDTKVLPKSKDAFWEQMRVAHSLHDFETVVMIDHMDCGAYKAEFNPANPEEEHAEHVRVMTDVTKELRTMKFNVDCYLMPADLSMPAERIVIPA